MKIMTWNVNRFNGNSSYEIWNEAKLRYSKRVLAYIKERITDKNDIAIIQEFPPYYKDEEMIKLYKNEYELLSWYDIDEKFGKPEKRNAKIISRTVALVTRESMWDLKEFSEAICFGMDGGKYNYVNKYVQIVNSEYKIGLLGVHIPVRDMAKDKPERGMEDLYNAVKEKPVPDVIVGDFNAGDYEKDKTDQDFIDNKKLYKQFIDELNFIDVISDKSTTNYSSPTRIDHFLINNTLQEKYVITPMVDYEEELSDHYPIVIELNKSF